MGDGCGGSMPKRGQEMVYNRVAHRCLLRRLHQERSRGHQMVPREPSDIARIGMLGAKRELLPVLGTLQAFRADEVSEVEDLRILEIRPLEGAQVRAFLKEWPSREVLNSLFTRN